MFVGKAVVVGPRASIFEAPLAVTQVFYSKLQHNSEVAVQACTREGSLGAQSH